MFADIDIFATMKKASSVVMLIFCCLQLVAQRDTVFFNSNWDTLPASHGASYFRLFEKLDSANQLYYFTDYYISGEKQSISSYKDVKGKRKSGQWQWYHKNGQISQQGTYNKNVRDGDWYEYFDDGSLKSKLKYISNPDPTVEYAELYDSKTRKQTLINGEGIYIIYYENGDTNTVGKVTKKVKTDIWKSYYEDGQLYYVEKYKIGVLQSGKSYDKAGNEYKYEEEEVMPSYLGGESALMQYLATVKYPAKAREDDIEGTVYVQFSVDKEGNVTNVSIARTSGSSLLDETASNHVSKSKKWNPGLQRGQTVVVQYVIPIKFMLN
jgi:TonB family protein